MRETKSYVFFVLHCFGFSVELNMFFAVVVESTSAKPLCFSGTIFLPMVTLRKTSEK